MLGLTFFHFHISFTKRKNAEVKWSLYQLKIICPTTSSATAEFLWKRKEENVILIAKYHPRIYTPQAVKLLFVQCSNFIRRLGNVNALSTEQRLSALGEDSLGNPLVGSASVISLKPLSEIYVSSGWLFYPTTHSGCSISLSSDPYKTYSGYSLWPYMGLGTHGYLHLQGFMSCSHLPLLKLGRFSLSVHAGQLDQSMPQECDFSKPNTSCPCADLGTLSNLGTVLVAQHCVQTSRLLLPPLVPHGLLWSSLSRLESSHSPLQKK